MISAGTVIFGTVDDEQGVQEARDYITRMKLTAENAKLYRNDGFVMVKLKEDWDARD